MLDNLESVTGQALAIQNTLPEAERGQIRSFLERIVGGQTIVLLGSRSGEEWRGQCFGRIAMSCGGWIRRRDRSWPKRCWRSTSRTGRGRRRFWRIKNLSLD